MTGTVLLLDGRAISSLAIARRLDQSGVTVHSGDTFRHNITAYSGSTTESHTYPSPGEEPEAFQQSVQSLIEQYGFDFVFPVRDETTRRIAEITERLPERTSTLLDTPEKIQQLQDKKQCGKLAARTGIPTPATYYPDEQDIKHIREVAEFPVLLKPTNESGSRGIQRVESGAELADAYRAATQNEDNLIIQEFIDQSGGHYSIGSVFDQDGYPRAVHVYEELLQYPDSGGPAIRARSVAVEPWVHEMLGLLEAIDWTGPAHMDVLFDPEDQTYKLLEVNPRIWSSIALTIDSGVDIPKVIIETATGLHQPTQSGYDTDVVYRWMLPNEILWAFDGWNTPARIKRLFRTDGSSTTHSILSWKDPGAVLGTALQSGRFLVDSEKRAQVIGRGWENDGEYSESDGNSEWTDATVTKGEYRYE